MPVTPFHFGPGLLIKGLIPRHFSFTGFVAAQVVIDVETVYWILRDAWPWHRVLHTVPGGAVVGTLAALATAAVVPPLARRLTTLLPTITRHLRARPAHLAAETSLVPALISGLVGGTSHAVLDAVMHPDVQPFRPLTASNPLLAAIPLPALHLACAAAGLVGIVLIVLAPRIRTAA
jgi:hypothetical protein